MKVIQVFLVFFLILHSLFSKPHSQGKKKVETYKQDEPLESSDSTENKMPSEPPLENDAKKNKVRKRPSSSSNEKAEVSIEPPVNVPKYNKAEIMLLEAVDESDYDKALDAFDLKVIPNPNLKTKDGETLIQKLANRTSGSPTIGAKIVKLLIEKGAKIEVKDELNRTPLHYAAIKGWLEIARVLLQSKADPNLKDKDGYTPYHYAKYNDYKDIAALLKEYGAKD